MTILPDMQTGTKLVSKSGVRASIHRVRRPRRDTGFDEPIYRLVFERSGVMGDTEWTKEELQTSGAVIEKGDTRC